MRIKEIKLCVVGFVLLGIGAYTGWEWGAASSREGINMEQRAASRRAPGLSVQQPRQEQQENSPGEKFDDELMKKYRNGVSSDEFMEKIISLEKNNAEMGNPKLREFLLKEWSRQHPLESLSFYTQRASDGKKGLNEVFYYCAQHHPEVAFEYLAGHREMFPDDWSLTESIRQIAARNAASTWEKMKKLSPRDQKVAMNVFLDSVADHDPEKLSGYLERVDFSEVKGMDILSLVKKLDQISPEECKKWVESLPEDMRKEAKENRLTALAGRNKEQFQEEYSALSDVEKRDFLWDNFHSLGHEMGIRAMADLLKDIKEFDEQVGFAAIDICSFWQNRGGGNEFLEWKEELPEGPLKDVVETRYAASLPFPEQEKNMNLIMTIKDQAKRNEILQEGMKKWHKTSPEQANKWLEGASLLKEEKESIQKSMQDSGE